MAILVIFKQVIVYSGGMNQSVFKKRFHYVQLNSVCQAEKK